MLQIDKVSLTMDSLLVLDNISLDLMDNECTVILGPSGSGKSTLLNLVAGLLVPDLGRVLLDGVEVTGVAGRASYMQQKHLLLPWLNLLDNCALPLTIKGISKQEARTRAMGLMEVFGLAGFENYYPSALSGGMCQRGALLRTYLSDCPLMLLDEPFASLDAITRRRLQEWLGEIRQRYKWSVLFVTHDIDEAIFLGHRIYILSGLPARVLQSFEVPQNREDQVALKAEIWNCLNRDSAVVAN
ncbi:MAG: ABC transporter ATP-binding protein [Methanomassiliicoccales archaeon]